MGKALAIIAAVFGVGWLVTRKPKPKKKTLAQRPPEEPELPRPDGPEPPVGEYVGSGWKTWPLKSQFPTEASFGQALQQLGYQPGYWSREDYTALDDATRAAVTIFQGDFNVVMEYRRKEEDVEAPEFPPVRTDLSLDGLIGPKTIQALSDAFVYQEVLDTYFVEIADALRKGLPIA